VRPDQISSSVPTAAAALTTQLRQTHIVDPDTAAAAAIIAAFPGALPAAAAAIAAVNPAAVSGAAAGATPRVAVPAGMYPTGNGMPGQVDPRLIPVRPWLTMLEFSCTDLLKLESDDLLSKVVINFNMRHHTTAACSTCPAAHSSTTR